MLPFFQKNINLFLTLKLLYEKTHTFTSLGSARTPKTKVYGLKDSQSWELLKVALFQGRCQQFILSRSGQNTFLLQHSRHRMSIPFKLQEFLEWHWNQKGEYFSGLQHNRFPLIVVSSHTQLHVSWDLWELEVDNPFHFKAVTWNRQRGPHGPHTFLSTKWWLTAIQRIIG